MANKKSLGSSPVEYKEKNNSKMGFIPDLGVSGSKKKEKDITPSAKKDTTKNNKESSKSSQKNKKKIVSYSLETEIVASIKKVAKKREMYYSTLVNKVLENWLAERDQST